MNRQPFHTPPRSWEPRMTPWLVRWLRPLIRRDLKRQRLVEFDVQGLDHLRGALAESAGVLITPNHSFHYDSYVLMEISHRVRRPFHFMTAWQVFQMSSRFERWMLQRHGCFSVDRESDDTLALKRSFDILTTGRHPLVIFPEGDIYHHCDHVSPFRDGAAAIALGAARRTARKIVVIPCSLKCFYLTDPTPSFEQTLSRLETALRWRPKPRLPIARRMQRIAEGLLTLKEMEYLGRSDVGTVADRVSRLIGTVLNRLEERHGRFRDGGLIPERVRNLRRTVIQKLEQPDLDAEARRGLLADMEDLFFVIQLYSYPDNYVTENPVIERIAETLDKFEEDVLNVTYPCVRGQRRVVVRFGQPIAVPKERNGREDVTEWTRLIESRVQAGLDAINAQEESSSPNRNGSGI